MTTPFDAWMPSYGPGTVPTRPWWRARVEDQTTTWDVTLGTVRRSYCFERSDGRRVGGAVVTAQRLPLSPPFVPIPAAWEMAAMAEVDADQPLPAPPPMPGQVWHYPNGMEIMLWGRSTVPGDGGTQVSGQIVHDTDPWPPPDALLVSGFGAPWAPAGWQP